MPLYAAALRGDASRKAAATVLMAASAAGVALNRKPKTVADSAPNDNDSDYRIEVHLMDRIQQKPYLTGSNRDNIPSTLRVLAIDLPEMRTKAFSGHCRLAHDKIFLDDVAKPKVIQTVARPLKRSSSSGDPSKGHNGINNGDAESSNNDKNGDNGNVDNSSVSQSNVDANAAKRKLKVAQKVILKSLVQCNSPQSQQRVGVELMEASIADLNRYGLRKTHQVGDFKYDPGKYYDSASSHDNRAQDRRRRRRHTRQPTQHSHSQQAEIIERDADDEELEDPDEQEEQAMMKQSDGYHHSIADEDELEAPWNQYAWKEELKLRIHGKVEHDAPMERGSRVRRYVLGGVYKITVPSAQNVWDWFLPPFLQNDPNGQDGNGGKPKSCWAANKPHAVIANGAALQRVPSALRLIQKYCKEADVPLYVIHDPRVWGGNTHETLSEALKEMRQEVKNRVVRQALKQHGSAAFARGRLVGQLEREAKWIAKDRSRRLQNFFTTQRRPTRLDGGSSASQQWHDLDGEALEQKLMQRSVIKMSTPAATNDPKPDGSGTKRQGKKTYSAGLVELFEHYQRQKEESTDDDNDATASDDKSPAE